MHRFFLPPELTKGDTVTLSQADARHAVQVLRLRAGDAVTILDGAGTELECELAEARPGAASARVLRRRLHPEPAFRVTLAQGIARGPVMEAVLKHAVELGCAAVAPLAAERSVSRPSEAEAKRERWDGIVLEAMKQSGSPWRTGLLPLTSAGAWARNPGAFDRILLCSLDPGAVPIWEAVRRRSAVEPPVRTAAVLVGPEGDFSPAEQAAFIAAGAVPVRLGPWVLRVETAALAALALVSSELARQG